MGTLMIYMVSLGIWNIWQGGAPEAFLYIATDKYLEHHLEKKSENRHSGDVLSIKSLEHTQNLYLEHFQAILRTSQ